MTTPAPRWARVVAHVIPLTTLPSGLWRICIALGLSLGMLEDGEPFRVSAAEGAYLVTLSVAIEALALLALGLVRPWGERVPPWLPRIGGRPIPAKPVVAVAGIGALFATAVAVMFFAPGNSIADVEATEAGSVVAVACYAPLLLWGPLLALLTYAYYRRRCRDGAAGGAARQPELEHA
jgi:hypothetical protein